MKARIIALSTALLSGAVSAQPQPGTTLTIYSTAGPGSMPAGVSRAAGGDASNLPGYVLVNARHAFSLTQGTATVRFDELPALVDPSSIRLDLGQSGQPELLGQRFQSGPASARELLQRAIGHIVEVTPPGGDRSTISGRLLAADDGLALQQENGAVRVIRDYADVRAADLPAEISAKPVVVWSLQSTAGGDFPLNVRYETAGMTWWADYEFSFSTERHTCTGALRATAHIVNRTGRSYEQVGLKLVAGDVHRVSANAAGTALRTTMMKAAPAQEFAEQSFSAYHLYRLERPVSLIDGAVEQLALFPRAAGIKCEQTRVYTGSVDRSTAMLRQPIVDPAYGAGADSGVRLSLAFRNTDENGLGLPLPAGRVRLREADRDGDWEFVGEDGIGHTAVGETVRLDLGRDFDVVAKRSQKDFQVDQGRRLLEEEIEIRLRNHRPQPVDIKVDEHLARWRQWKIVDANQTFDKQDADTIRFPVQVPARGEATVRYRVRYTW